ncbi:hypothetical protein K458DRAFT_424377 [Lentithecium fluviatile CBS 122367]|uniref:Uncharacterized protein n=1 Tax=Lentithecium fluviatile CBS 122367 TaxID=1168545 RepID=A0A6G1IF94_9PLEO|nr:hypothetical protein K458DRAFT_424377 [Lentithecium fluviatile CBS 122367]
MFAKSLTPSGRSEIKKPGPHNPPTTIQWRHPPTPRLSSSLLHIIQANPTLQKYANAPRECKSKTTA